jgi:hypothetical protein
MSGNGARARFDRRVQFKQRHPSWDEHRHALFASNPGIDDVRPFLHHVTALHFIFCLVVDAVRGTGVLMRKALLDPVAVEAEFVKQRWSGPPQVVNGERLQRLTFFLRLLDISYVTRLNVARDIGASAS